jgi:L-glyceraldehyde 3-phosphate reductase
MGLWTPEHAATLLPAVAVMLALAWLLRDEVVTSVLIGVSRPAQVLDNVKALKNIAFTAEELSEIDRVSME